MEITRVAPELREPMRRITRIAIPTDRPWGRRAVQTLLAVMPAAKVEGVTIERRRTESVSVRLYRPAVQHSTSALFWIHGGGLIIGRAVQNDRHCALTAHELGALVVSVEYRKAPTHPFPAALDDCYAGWRWLQREASQLGIAPTRVAVGGESAGGGLAASLAQRLSDDGETTHCAQWLFCPMLDDRTAARHDLDQVNHFVWTNRMNRVGWRAYLGLEPGAARVPAYAVPARRQDLRGLPPAWIGVGDIDLFYEEDRTYAERLRATGVAVTFDVVPGAPHGIASWAGDSPITREHIRRAQNWLGQTLETRTGAGD
jgi:acetyl esterase/lipase